MATRGTVRRTKPSLCGQNVRVLQPKLRMIANSDPTVNTLRAEISAAVQVTNPMLLKPIPRVREECTQALPASRLAVSTTAIRRLKPEAAL